MMDREKLIERARDWLKQNDKFDYLREASLSTVMADFANSERKAAVDEFLSAVRASVKEEHCNLGDAYDDYGSALSEVYAEMFGPNE